MGELSGQVALITGGGSGIGRSITKVLSREGAYVAIADLDHNAAESVGKEVIDQGGVALILMTDCSKVDDVNKMVKATLDRFGRIDILVNCVGIGYGAMGYIKTNQILVENYPEEDWDKVMNINLKSMFLCSKLVIPVMKKQRYGNIISISSSAGKRGGGLSGSGPAYAASKAGMINLSKTLARQLGPYNIRVNCIAPGSIGAADPNGTQTVGFLMTEEEIDRAKQTSPLHKIGSPIDVSNSLLFLVSKRAKFITGVTLDVDGGKGMY